LVTSRILQRRRLHPQTGRPPAGPNRRSATPVRRRRSGRPLAGIQAGAVVGVAAERLRFGAYGRIYAAGAAVLALAICYLAVAAQVTQTTYELNRLQAQQAQLRAEQDQLRYQQVTMHTPARVATGAQAAGLVSVTPAKYLGYQPVALDLGAPTGDQPVDGSPLWQRAVASVLNGVGMTRDVAAAEK